MEKKEDRRVRLSKQIIRDSLIELMQIYPITKISVKMICEKADVNRSTFYAHYKDQNDLLNTIQAEAVKNIKTHVFATSFIQEEQSATPIIVKVLEYCKENSRLFRVILSENGNTTFQKDLMLLVQEKSLEEITEAHKIDPRTNKYIEIFAISGILSMVRLWLKDGCIDEPVALAQLISKLMYEGILGFFR